MADVDPELTEENEGLEGSASTTELAQDVPPIALTKELVGANLSLLCKTGTGLAHAYVKVDLKDKNLGDITALSAFTHLRYVDLAQNKVTDLTALNPLTHLLTLNCEHNHLVAANLEEKAYLQQANFSSNKITTVEGISHPLLEVLNLSFNEIPSLKNFSVDRLSHLHTLELRGNKLTSTAGIALPSLKNLYLASNQITQLELRKLRSLERLHLRDNQIESLDSFTTDSLPALTYLNLRGNKISQISEIAKLEKLPALKMLVCLDNPLAEIEDYRVEVLIALSKLDKLDKELYTDDERRDAEALAMERKEETEKQQQAEREAALAEEDS
eukprot:Colp12_sorted_trinity150504_noHs@9164